MPMRRTLTRPRNPELLGRVFAALRVYSGQREPTHDAERGINDRLNAYGASAQAARRMVATLDAMPASAREQLLGAVAAPDFVPAEEVAPTTLNVTFTTDTKALLEGAQDVLGGSATVSATEPQPPVYTIHYNGLWCQEETTWDWASLSDEIYLITSAVHVTNGKNQVTTERHPVAATETWYDDLDSGEERQGPVAACWFGNSDPVSLTAIVVEHDQGDPDALKDEVDALVKAIVAVLTYVYPALKWLELLRDPIADAINWLLDTDDDPIETQTVVLPGAQLEKYASQWPGPHLGSRTDSGGPFGFSTEVPVSTNFSQHFITAHRGGGATYVAGFEIVRDPPLDRWVIVYK
jgi:hypothetical protein